MGSPAASPLSRRFAAALLPRLFGNNVPGQTTRAPPVGFEPGTNGIQFYAIANLDKRHKPEPHNYRYGMSCPSWQRHRTGCRRSPIRILPLPPVAFASVAPLPVWCDSDRAAWDAGHDELKLRRTSAFNGNFGSETSGPDSTAARRTDSDPPRQNHHTAIIQPILFGLKSSCGSSPRRVPGQPAERRVRPVGVQWPRHVGRAVAVPTLGNSDHDGIDCIHTGSITLPVSTMLFKGLFQNVTV